MRRPVPVDPDRRIKRGCAAPKVYPHDYRPVHAEIELRDCDRAGTDPKRIEQSFTGANCPPNRDIPDSAMAALLAARPTVMPRSVIRNLRAQYPTRGPLTCWYGRYSSDDQANSRPSQKATIERYYEMNRDRLRMPPLCDIEFFDEAVSGNKRFMERRWGGQLSVFLRPGDHIVTAYFDRMGRNTVDLLTCMAAFARLRIHVHCIDAPWMQYADPNSPDTIRNIEAMATASAGFRRVNARRVSDAMHLRRARGFSAGDCGIPIGYYRRKNPRYVQMPRGVKNPIENAMYLVYKSEYDSAVVEEICRVWLAGWTTPEIRHALEARGIVRAETGKPWNKKMIRYVLNNLRSRSRASGMDAVINVPAERACLPSPYDAMGTGRT